VVRAAVIEADEPRRLSFGPCCTRPGRWCASPGVPQTLP